MIDTNWVLGDNDLIFKPPMMITMPPKVEVWVMYVVGVGEIPSNLLTGMKPAPVADIDLFVLDNKPVQVEVDCIYDIFSWAWYCIHASAIARYRSVLQKLTSSFQKHIPLLLT